jgi:hypothetical protein
MDFIWHLSGEKGTLASVPFNLAYLALVPMATMKMMAMPVVNKIYMIVMLNLLMSTIFAVNVVVTFVFRMMRAVVDTRGSSGTCFWPSALVHVTGMNMVVMSVMQIVQVIVVFFPNMTTSRPMNVAMVAFMNLMMSACCKGRVAETE